ncbi:hypothetical protein C8R46DRAFT_1201292 [Mycena filopes]|nr:hypothetical protein C8R46DRAFT_1201292 [Mycena filopes]
MSSPDRSRSCVAPRFSISLVAEAICEKGMFRISDHLTSFIFWPTTIPPAPRAGARKPGINTERLFFTAFPRGVSSVGPTTISMAPPRLFRSSASKWVSPLITIARGIVSIGNCAPFPYVGTALASALALLELIETVGQSGEDLKYLAESVITIMHLLSEEINAHPTTLQCSPKFRQVCVEFNSHLLQLSKDLGTMSRSWTSSKLKRYLNSRNIREEIAQFTRRVHDARANATLVAATGTRMDLAAVAIGVAAVESRLSELQRDLTSPPAVESPKDLVRFEEDFHALKLGDIHLDFRTAEPANFRLRFSGGDEKHIGWTDYNVTVNGCIRKVRVYQGSDPAESWKEFLSFLGYYSPSPYLPQLFGFCTSPKLKCLVFHGEYQTLDEYAAGLPSPLAIVKWELALVTDIFNLVLTQETAPTFPNFSIISAAPFARINANNGAFLLSHVAHAAPNRLTDLHYGNPPFLQWFQSRVQNPWIGDSEWRKRFQVLDMRGALSVLVDLKRRCERPVVREILLSRGHVYPLAGSTPVVGLVQRKDISQAGPWVVDRALHSINAWGDFGDGREWPPDSAWPRLGNTRSDGFTHFILPLAPSWVTHDHTTRSGYFLRAEVEFGQSVPDITTAWLLQASSILSKLPGEILKPSNFGIPVRTFLRLEWEMVLRAEATPTTLDSIAVFEDLPKEIHVFVQIPVISAGSVREPHIYWSTDPNITATSNIPPGALEIWMAWRALSESVGWEPHHYEVVRAIQQQNGFDPDTNLAAQHLELPLLDIEAPAATDSSNFAGDDSSQSWTGNHPYN